MGVLQSVERKLGRNSKPVGDWLELQQDSCSDELILFKPDSNIEERKDLCRVSIKKSNNKPNFSNLPSSLPFGIHLHRAVILNSKIYVFGGSTRKELNSNCFLEYNLDSKKWKILPSFVECKESDHGGPSLFSSTTSQTNLPTSSRTYLNPCFYHSVSACPKRNKIYVFGGRTSSVISSNNLYEFDLTTEEWKILNPIRITKKNQFTRERLPRREGHSSFIRNDCLYIVAGYEYNTDQYSNEIIEINLENQSWKFLSEVDNNSKPANPTFQLPSILLSTQHPPPNERISSSSTEPHFTKLAYHTSVYCEIKDELIIYGGKTREKPFGPLTNSLHVYSFQKKEWTAFNAPPLVKSGFISYDDNRQFIRSYNKGGNLFNDRYLIVSNGLINDHYDRRHYINEVLVIDVHTNQWYKINNSNLLNMYYDSFLIFHEKKCFAIGGYNPCIEKPHLDTVIELNLKLSSEEQIGRGMERFLEFNHPLKMRDVKSNEGLTCLIPNILLRRLDECGNLEENPETSVELETSINCLELLRDWLIGKDLEASANELIELYTFTLQFKSSLESSLHPYILFKLRNGALNKNNFEEALSKCSDIPVLRSVCEEFSKSIEDHYVINQIIQFKYPLENLLEYFAQLRKEIKNGKRKGDLSLTLETNSNLVVTLDSEICTITSQFFSKLISGQFSERSSSIIALNNDITLDDSDLNDLVDLLYLQPPSNLMKCTNRLEIINQIYRISDFYCIDWMTDSMNYLLPLTEQY